MAVRRNVLSLSTSERAALLAGFKAMKANGAYDPFIRLHALATRWTSVNGTSLNAAHMGPAFLPWHRKFILDFEATLEEATDGVVQGLPYYDSTDGMGRSSPVWGNDLMGGAGSPVTGPFAPVVWRTRDANDQPSRGLNRGLQSTDGWPPLPTRTDVHLVMYRKTYDVKPFDGTSRSGLRNALEGFLPFGLHNAFHAWVGGQMAVVAVAPNDPVFFLHHCNIDRIWAQWQLVNPAAPQYLPTSGAAPGQNLDDAMYPWNQPATRTRPADVLSSTALGYSYDAFYEIGTLQIVITTGSTTFAGTDDDVSFVISKSGDAVLHAFWSVVLDASHCDHADPFERGQVDTFTYTSVHNMAQTGIPLTPAVLGQFSLGKAPSGSWFGRGDWTVAGLKILADGLVLYDDQTLDQQLDDAHQHLDDGHGNTLDPRPRRSTP